MSGPGFVDGGTFSAAVVCLPDHVTWLTLTSTVRAGLDSRRYVSLESNLGATPSGPMDSGRNVT